MVAAVRRARSWWQKHPVIGWGVVASTVIVALALGSLSAAALTQAYVVNVVNLATNWNTATVANLNTNDDNTSYANTTTQNAVLRVGMADTPLDLGAINSVTVNARVRNRTGGAAGDITVQLGSYLGGTSDWYATTYTLPSSTAYSTITYPNVARPGGGGWTWTDIQNLEVLTRATAIDGATYTYRVSYIEVVVDYTPYTTTNVTLGDGAADPPAANVLPSQLLVPVDQFTLQRTAGNKPSVVNTVTITRPNTTTPITAVNVYTDISGNGVIDGADASVGTGTFGATTTATITIDQNVSDTLTSYLVVYSFGAGTDGQVTSATISNATYTMIDGWTETDDVGSTFTVRPITVTAGNGTDPAAQNIATSQTNVVIDAFTLTRSAGSAAGTVSTLTVNNTGTAASLATVQIYRDVNQNGFLDLGVDVPLHGTPATAGTANTVVTLSSPETVDGATRYYLVVGATSATNGTITASISAATGFLSTFVDNDTGNTFTVAAGAATTVAVGTGADPAGTTVTPGQADVAVDAFMLSRTVGNRNPSVGTITVTNGGTGTPASTVSAVDIYRDTNNSGAFDAGDEKLNTASGTFTGTTSTVTLANVEYVYGTARRYFVVYTFAGTAVDATTASARVSAMTGTNLDAVNNSDTGNLFTVQSPVTTVVLGNGPIVAATQVSPGQTGVAANAFTLQRTVGSKASTVSAITVANTGTGTPASTVSGVDIYRDNGDGLFGVGDTKINTASGTFTGATAKVTLTAAEAVDNTADTYFVVYNFAAGAADNATANANASIVAGDFANIDTLTDNDPVGNDYTVKINTTVVLGNGPIVAAAQVSPGQTGVAVNAFTLQRTVGSKASTVSAITVANTGTGTPASTVSGVDIYRDNGDGLFGVGDTKINTASGTFTGATAKVTLTAAEAVDNTADTYFVVYNFAAGAADNATANANASIVAGDFANIDTLTDNDPVGNDYTVKWPTNVTLGDGANDPSGEVWPGQNAVAVDQFTLQRTQGSKASTVNTVTVTRTGTAAISNVYIYSDGGTLGVIDGTDASIVSGTFSGSTATLAINRAVGDTLTSYLVVYDIPSSATDGQWTTAEITNATHANIDAFTEADNLGFTFTVRLTNVTLGDGANDPAAAGVTAGQTALAVNQFTLQRTQGPKAATVNTVTVTRPTTAGSIAISNVHIYSDGGTLGVIDGTDVPIASGTFSGATATLSINQAVGTTLASYLVVYDIPVGAVAGQTTTAEITAATYANVDNFTESDDVGSTFTVVTDGTAPTNPTNVGNAAGTTPYTIASVWWDASTDNVGVAGYRIYRATALAGPFVIVGTSATARAAGDPWLDTTGVTGQDYWYRVSAYDAAGNESAQVSAAPSPVKATWTLVPHETYTSDGRLCRVCHEPHEAATALNIFKPTSEAPGETGVCNTCHDGSGAKTNVKTGAVNSFALSSGHTLQPIDTSSDLTNNCSGCHNPHKDVDSGSMLPAETINGVTITGTGNAWCGACHNAAASWYAPGGYAALLANPSRDATGYPTVGTYPGPAVYTSALSPHGNIAVGEGIPASMTIDPMVPTRTVNRTQGDCLWCHSSHRSASAYDSLNGQFRPTTAATLAADQTNGTYAEACLNCHGGDPSWIAKGAADVKQHVTAGRAGSGHRIQSAGALYPVDAPMPCYECHNPHGSAANTAGLAVMTMTDGTTRVLLGDSPGEIDISTPVGVRRFCFGCHTASGNVASGDGRPYGWNGTAYAEVLTANAKVAGVSRITYDSIGKKGLKLPPVPGHYRDDTDSCSKCHGNIHNPGPGLSAGGVPCYSCHSEHQKYMEDNVGAARGGPERLTVYHHVLGGTENLGSGNQYYDGDVAPGPGGTYPTLDIMGPDVFCVSCHVDHDKFNATPGANLRIGATPTATNSDFVAAAPAGGTCTSCHGLSMPKDSIDQKPGTNLAQSVTPSAYSASAHQYKVNSEFGAGNVFQADCSKCHNDEQPKVFATSTYRFSTHWSATNRIISAFGGAVTESLGEQHCYGCHTGSGAGNDYYGARAMSAEARGTKAEFALAGSTHDLATVECVNCHNVHEASVAAPVADPDNTYTPAAWTTKTDKNTYCLKCHDGTLPSTAGNSGTTFVPYNVTAPASANVSAYYSTSGHGATAPGTPYTNRSDTRYATTFNPQVGAWTNGSNSTGVPNGTVATSPTTNVFEGRQIFAMPVGASSISAASLTVRSRAAGAWGATPSAQQIRYSTSDVTTVNWAEGVAGADGDTALFNEIDDPAPSTAHDGDTTYIVSSGTGAYQAGSPVPTVPANATNISVSIVWTVRDGTTNTQTNTSRLRVGGTYYTFGTTRNPGTTYTTFTDTWANNPATGTAWTQATVNTINGLGFATSGTTAMRITQGFIQIDYTLPNDDTWAIQYTTNGSAWVDFPGFAASSVAEAALTDHTVDLTGILTPANAGTFAVRILGAAVGAADNAGTIEWDSSSLALTYSGTDPGPTMASCRDCHEQHGSSLTYLLSPTVDGQSVSSYSLLPDGTGLADQKQCLACHRAGGAAAAANISRYYPVSAGGTATAAMDRSGHRIKTGPYAGRAVPCRACHNPHGAASGGYMLAVRTNVNGTDTIIGDSGTELAMSATAQQTAANVRRFCLSCHITSDATGQGWNGTAMVNITSGQVLGINRTGGFLKLPGYKGHAAADTDSCYVCHGDDFTQATSVNVHNPASGESRGGIPCYKCHTVYRDQKEDTAGSEVGGADRLLSYHHVLGNGAVDGDNTFTSTTYPTTVSAAAQPVHCLSCHVDHNLFSPLVNSAFDRANNLRANFTAATPIATNTDYNSTGNTSVCLGCHATVLTKDNANKKSDGTLTTPAITAAQFGPSAHDYYATSTFNDAIGATTTSTFNANCVKCHDSEIDGGGMERGAKTTGYQTSANKFSAHVSTNRRILAAMGVTIVDPSAEERVCYACHSLSTDGFKTTANRDWYNAIGMSAPSQTTFALMNRTYRHNVGGYTGIHRPSPTDETQAYISANKHVECADCHNVHASTTVRHTRGTNAVSGALTGVSGVNPTYTANSNWANPTSYTALTSATTEYQICFKCHSGANTSYASWGGTGAASWTDVALDFNTNNGSYHPVVAALPATDPSDAYGSSRLRAANMRASGTVNGYPVGGFAVGSTMYCSDCHAADDAASLGPHGSSVKWMLKGPNQAWPYTTRAANGTNNTTGYRLHSAMQSGVADGPDGIFCNNCHVLTTVGNAHGTFDKHGSAACVGCHVRVPHGSKTTRLLASIGSAASYPGGMPLRLTSNGAGTNAGSFFLRWVDKPTAGSNFGLGDCSTSGCADHPTGTITGQDAAW